jgi:hypothetical protein
LNSHPSKNDTAIERDVITMKKIGIIHNSASLADRSGAQDINEGGCHLNAPGERKKATFENNSEGVNNDTFNRLICCMCGVLIT